MILAIDIGNTNIVIGCIDANKTYFIERLSTVRTKTELEYAVDIKTVLDIYHINKNDIEGGIISSVVSSATAFGMMDEMDEKGVTINAAFSISGSFIIGSHLAFTLAFSPDCLFAVIIGKLFAGILAIIVAEFFIRKKERSVSIQC